MSPIIICPYLHDYEARKVRAAFGLDVDRGRNLPFFLWQDRYKIGPERAFEYCWRQFPERDVIILHADMAPMPDDLSNRWFRDLCDFAQQLPDAGIVACDLLYPQRMDSGDWSVQCAGGIFREGQIDYVHGRHLPYGDSFRTVREVAWATFGGIYIRRHAIEVCGAFDARYEWAYCMDVDYSLEIRRRGLKIYQIPVSLLHEESGTTKDFLCQEEYRAKVDLNLQRFYEKWRGHPLLSWPDGSSIDGNGTVEAKADSFCQGSIRPNWERPAPFFRGRSHRVSAVVANLSGLIWPCSGDHPVTISYHWLRSDGEFEIFDGLRTFLPRDLAPNDEIQLDIDVESPASSGFFRLQLSLVNEGRFWFEDHGFEMAERTVEVLDERQFVRGGAHALHSIEKPRPGELRTVAVRLRNESDSIWLADGADRVAIASHWHGSDVVGDWEGLRTPLPHDLAPGEQVTVAAAVKLPEFLGNYVLEWTAVQAQAGWFENSDEFRSHLVEVEVLEAGPSIARSDNARSQKWLYQDWVERHATLDVHDRSDAANLVRSWTKNVQFTIIITGADLDEPRLRSSVESIDTQIYPHWKLCVIADGSASSNAIEALAAISNRDPRILPLVQSQSGSLYAALNDALRGASGEFVVLLEAGDRLAPHALLFVAGEIICNDNLDWIYYDIDYLDDNGMRHAPDFRSGPNKDLFLAHDFMAKQASFRTSRLREIGGWREGFDGAHNHDLGLRLYECIKESSICHIPHLLHHVKGEPWEGACRADVAAIAADERCVTEHLERLGQLARVTMLHNGAGLRIRYALPDELPLVSIIIPTRDRSELLRPCIASILERTDYANFEILIIDNGSSEPETKSYFSYLESSGFARIIVCDAPFNWSLLNNVGASHAKGDVLCFLNNDTEVITESWLSELVSHALRPEIGIVGPALWYPDNHSQHRGIVLGIGGIAWYPFHRVCRGQGLHPRNLLAQNYSAVTGACVVLRRSVFDAANGFPEQHLPIGYGDIDFCLSVAQQQQLRILWTPFSELYHYESASRGIPSQPAEVRRAEREVQYTINRWAAQIADDPYFNPNLALIPSSILEPADPPRVAVRKSLRHYGGAGAPKLAFCAIPGVDGSRVPQRLLWENNGSQVRQRLLRENSLRTVMIANGQEIVEASDGVDTPSSRFMHTRAIRADVWFGAFESGIGDRLGIDCVQATFIRDPVRRVIAHYLALIESADSPLGDDSPLRKLSVVEMLRKGIIPANLMCRRLLGERAEAASWQQIEAGGRTYSSHFCGFSLPAEIWAGNDTLILRGDDQLPVSSADLCDRALTEMRTRFGFVGIHEDMQRQLNTLGDKLGWEWEPHSASVESALDAPAVDLDEESIRVIEAFNCEDRKLFEHVSSLTDSMWFDELRIKSTTGKFKRSRVRYRAPGLMILGMHRSGTSCLAGMLECAGFQAGKVTTWNINNAKGNREDPLINLLSERILAASGGSWDSPPKRLCWTAEHGAERDLILKRLRSEGRPWVFKDPRNLLTLPFWLESDLPLLRIGIIRNVLSVAQSLAVRDDMPLARGIELWTSYNEALIREHERSPFPVVCFDVQREDFISAVAKALASVFPDWIEVGEIDLEGLGKFVDPTLNHSQIEMSESLRLLRSVAGVDEFLLRRTESVCKALLEIAGLHSTPITEGDRTAADSESAVAGLIRLDHALAHGDTQGAYALCNEMVDAYPARSDLWLRLVSLTQSTGDPNNVQDAVHRGLAAMPNDPRLLLQQAELSWAAGQFEDALRAAERAFVNAPDWIELRTRIENWRSSMASAKIEIAPR